MIFYSRQLSLGYFFFFQSVTKFNSITSNIMLFIESESLSPTAIHVWNTRVLHRSQKQDRSNLHTARVRSDLDLSCTDTDGNDKSNLHGFALHRPKSQRQWNGQVSTFTQQTDGWEGGLCYVELHDRLLARTRASVDWEVGNCRACRKIPIVAEV